LLIVPPSWHGDKKLVYQVSDVSSSLGTTRILEKL